MAEPKSRAVIVGKLLLLVILPLSLLAGLFGTGVHLGHKHRATLLTVERDWLGMDVEVPLVGDGKLLAMLDGASAALGPASEASAASPGATGALGAPGPAAGATAGVPSPTGAGADTATGMATGPATGPANAWPHAGAAVAATGSPTGEGASGATPTGMPPANAGASAPATTPPTLANTYPLAAAQVVADDLRNAYNRVRVLKVKVLVDRAYIDSHEDWLSQIEALMNAASANQSELFGMQLQLWGVVEWDVPARGLDVEQLHADLRTRQREGADLLLGITGRALDHTRRNGWSETPDRRALRNTAFAVVYADPDRPDRLLRAVLHEFAHCFGAHDVTDPATEAWRMGSIMSYANVSSETPPWFDPENVRAILSRKHHEIERADSSPVAGSGEHAGGSKPAVPKPGANEGTTGGGR